MYSLLRRKRKRNNNRLRPFYRRSRLEPLETRLVLSAPSVADVNVSSTDWAMDFIDYLEDESLGTDGYSIPVGSSDQLDALPWTNIDQIKITFSEDVDVQMGDLSLSGVNTTAYAFSDFSYDSGTYTATWTLPNAIEKDKLLLDLDADGIDPIEDASSNDLDGEWTTSSSTYNSGNGTAGGDFEFRFNVLPGDGYTSNGVNILDPMMANTQRGKDAGDAGYIAQYDVDGDATITQTDCDAMFSYLGDGLPVGDPAGMSNDAPSTANFADILVQRNAVDQVLDLWDAFDDAEDADTDLSYAVVANSNPAIFDSVDIDELTGELTFDYKANTSGESKITVRSTDTAGLITDTIFTVTVNDPPVISNFNGYDLGYDVWTFSGTVTDVDDDVEGMIVTLGGVLAEYNVTATVLANGTFSVTELFIGLTSGYATAQTEDDDGAESNIAYYYCSVS